MKRLEEISWSYTQACREVEQFQELLDPKIDLGERDRILPFFRDRRDLAALCGVFNPYITVPDRIGYEFDLFGDYACDLVVGNWQKAYCFVEFEDAREKSIFEKKGRKATLEWGEAVRAWFQPDY